ncbi:tetratricopeptide repeat protein [Pseudoxanthomonas wuyuanensis]|uniref:Cytochrome c-type biogenesis protein CcmH n=1 Tax=Pseudoxanthomonas wuyuanensis TaxID=1073196 RepID=A0A286D8X7_9GAMM|nr:tetratricopeptide repeat protein [Pseudoxanthomonas wuyuanensis]KAF1722131.1 cytochrome C biogenesis protein [Pseudoxanthomonas wuyuanensis]SOD55116.1 cytochrome c-type biogenesis protein CcmH [Pseudoxanthomonas wuyuanensis]
MPLFAALAVSLTLLALIGALWPLWRNSRGLALGIIGALVVATLALYRLVGTPAALQMAETDPARMPASLTEAIAQLEAELVKHPNEPEGWRLLGRSYASQERYAEARDAFAKAVKLLPDDPNLLTEAAQSRLFADPERKLDAEAVSMLQHALVLDPQHQRARWFLGVSQRQNGQPAEAAKTWEPLLAQVDAGTGATLRAQINEVRAEAGLPPLADAAAPAPAASPNALTVKVALDPDFAARMRLRGETSVFVIARIPDGPPMPVAVQKHGLQDLPLNITLSDNDSPMPTQKLSALREVELVARLSASGNAMRQEGDLESAPVRVSLPASAPVELVIGAQ